MDLERSEQVGQLPRHGWDGDLAAARRHPADAARARGLDKAAEVIEAARHAD